MRQAASSARRRTCRYVCLAALLTSLPAYAAVSVFHESGQPVDAIWLMPQVEASGGGLEYVTYAIRLEGAPASVNLLWDCTAPPPWTPSPECGALSPATGILSLTPQDPGNTIWNVTSVVQPGDLPAGTDPVGAGKVLIVDGLTQLGELPSRIPSIDQLKPVVACPAFDRPGFIKGKPVGTDIPVDQTFPQITYATVKPCGVCDFTLNGWSPVTVDVKFKYQGTEHGGEDCDSGQDDACDPSECSDVNNGDVWRKDFDVQPFEQDSPSNPDPLTVFIEASNNVNQTATTQKDMELVVQLTKGERDAPQSPPALPLWAADPKQYLIELVPALEDLGEYLALNHSMELKEEVNASIGIRANVELPAENDGNTSDVGEGSPGVEDDGGSGKSFEFSAQGGFLYEMTLETSPSSSDLSNNMKISGQAEIAVNSGGREFILGCELTGTGQSPGSASLIDVLTAFELTEVTGGCDLEVTIYGVVYKVKNKVMRRFVKEIAAAINGLLGASVTMEGNGLDVDSWDLTQLGVGPGLKGIIEFTADIKAAEVDVAVEGKITVPIEFFPQGGTDCDGATWCVTVGASVGGEAGLEARVGRFTLVSTSAKAEVSRQLAVVKPSGSNASVDGDPGVPSPAVTAPAIPRPSFITGTDAAVDSKNHLWLAFIAGTGSQQTSATLNEGTLVVWNCGTDHGCTSKVEYVFGDVDHFAHSPAIAIGPDDRPVVAWARAVIDSTDPQNHTVDYTKAELLTAKFDTTPAPGFGPWNSIAAADKFRYGLSLDVSPATALFAARASLAYIEDRTNDRFACTDAEASCGNPLPVNDVELLQYDFDTSGNATTTATLTLSSIGSFVRDNPDVAIDSTGLALVVWDEFIPFDDDRQPPDLFGRLVNPAGGTLGSAKKLTSNSYVDTQPAVEFDTTGNALLAWSVITEARNVGTGAMNTLLGGAGSASSRATGPPAVVVAAKADGGSNLDLWVYDEVPPTSGTPRQVTDDPYDQRAPAVRDQIAVYSSREDGGDHYDIWLIDLRDDTRTRLTEDPYHQRMPVLHVGAGPLDTATIQVVYVSDEPGTGGPAASDNLWRLAFSLATLPAVQKTQLSDTESAEHRPTFDDAGDALLFSTSTRLVDRGGPVEVPADGCNLWRLDITDPENPLRSPFTDDPGCDTEPAWLGDRVVYRCDYLDRLVERSRPEAPCQLQLEAFAAGGEAGYAFSWDFGGGQSAQGQEVAWHFGDCSPNGTPVVHDIELTATDCADGTPGCVQSSFVTGLTVTTDGLRPPLRADLGVSNGTLLAPVGPASPGQAVRFAGKIAGGEPPYQARFVFGDGNASSFEDVTGHLISAISHTYQPTALGSDPYLGRVEVRDSLGRTASRDFRIDIGPLREVRPGSGLPGHPLKAIAQPVLPYHKRPRRGLCEASASNPPALGGAVTRLLDGGPPGTDMTDARSPSLGPNDQLMFYMRPGGNPIGVADDLVLATFAAPGARSLGSVGPLPGLTPPNQPQPSELLQYGEYSLVRMAVARPIFFGGVAVGPPVDVNRPGLFARHPKIAPGPGGSFIVVWRGDHTGGQEQVQVGLDGDMFFSKGKVAALALVQGQFVAHQPQIAVAGTGLLDPGKYVSWRGRIVTGTSGNPTVIWVDKDVDSQNDDLLRFNSSQAFPGGNGPPFPPFGSDGQGQFELGNGDGTFCPLNPEYDGPPQGPFALNLGITTGSDGAFSIDGPVFPEIPIDATRALLITGVSPWAGQVGFDGQVSVGGPAQVTLNDGGILTGLPDIAVTFTTEPLTVASTHPGDDAQYCTPDDRPGTPFELYGQPVDANGVAVTNAVMTIDGVPPGPFELLAQMTLHVHSESLAERRLLLSETGLNRVLRFERTSGTSLGVFGDASFIPSSLGMPSGLALGPDGKLYVGDGATGRILRFDGLTGSFQGVFVPAPGDPALGGGLGGPGALRFGPDDHLYVASADNSIKRYDGTSGFYLGDLVAPGSDGLDGAGHFIFGPDDRVYASSTATDSVKLYDANTGTGLGDFISPGGGGLDAPHDLTFGPDNNFYVTSTDRVLRYVPSGGVPPTGVPTGTFGEASFEGSGLNGPVGLAFGPNHHLFVSSPTTRDVRRYDPAGNFTGIFGEAQDLETPTFLTFIPTDDGDLDGLPDDVDTCLGFASPDNTDTDGDGLGDVCDSCPLDALNDVDADTHCADVDNCPDVANLDQSDVDGDGVGDLCDTCPDVSNPNQQPRLFETIFASDRQTLTWSAPSDISFVEGDLAEMGTYTTTSAGQLTGSTSLDISTIPMPGSGLWFLVRHTECGTWGSAARDAVLN